MKPPKITKAQQQDLEQGWKARNKWLVSLGMKKETYEQYVEWVYGRGKKTRSKKELYTANPSRPAASNKKEVPNCIKDWTTGVCSTKESLKYTGEEIVGLSTLHKSCIQPVFNKESAKDIAKMRR